MAVPSACWPHAVFPGLSGNKGRKTPFYSITPAALGHRANTKESGFIKTISARNQPNKLIYHQPCSEWEGLRRHRDRLVFRGCGWFPDSVHKKDRHLSHGPHFYQMCVWSCCACISEWVGGFEETWQQLPIQSSRQNATLTTVCTLVFFFCFFVHHCLSQKHMKLGEGGRGGNMNALPARRLGIWGGFTQGERKSERKVEMLPGAPHRRQTLYMRGGGEEE